MAGNITSLTINGVSVPIEPTMIFNVPDWKMPVPIVLTIDSGTIEVNGVDVESGEPFMADILKTRRYLIKARAGQAKNDYILRCVPMDGIQEVGTTLMYNIGWFGARCIEGDLDTYQTGGMTIPKLGSYAPKYAICVQIENGLIGYFDCELKKLIVYTAPGVEAVPRSPVIGDSRYRLILKE